VFLNDTAPTTYHKATHSGASSFIHGKPGRRARVGFEKLLSDCLSDDKSLRF
jgi:hypothetical protein